MMIPPYPPGGIPVVDEVPPALAPEPAPLVDGPLFLVTGAALAVVVLAVVVFVVVRRRRARRTGQATAAPAGPVQDHEVTEPGPDKAPGSSPGRSRQDRADMIRTTTAPLVLGGVVLWLVFDGLEAFAQDSMGMERPMSFAVIVAFEFVAMWLCWERFARAQKNHPDVPALMAGQWVLLALAMLFQYDHAIHDELTTVGTVARVALPAILGGVVEWALHSRRTTVRSNEDEDAGRLFDHSLKSNPVLFLRSRYVLAAHASWTSEDAVQHVRTQDAKTLALRLRALINNPPTAPVPPAPVADPAAPFIPDGATDKAVDRVQRNYERAVQRAEDIRARRARDHTAALARHRRAVTAHDRRVARLRDRLVVALDALGFTGGPTDTPAADMLRAVQVGVMVDEMVTLDYSDPHEAARWFGGLITGGDLEAARVDRRALEDGAASTHPGSSTVGVGGVDTNEAAPPVPGVDVHSDPTPPPTPAPDGGVEAAPNGVGHRVDEADTDPVSDMSPVPVPGVPSTPAPDGGVDEVEAAPDGFAPGVDVHPGPVWRSPGLHPDEVEAAPNGVDHGVEANTPAPSPAPVEATDGDHDEDDTDPDDEGPGPRGGGVPAPAPVDVLPGQITITDALEGAPAPAPLDVARLALDAPVWDDVADEKAKKPKVMALLWEFSGDVTAARAAWQDRMVDEFPRDVYRSGSRGYAWQWHHEVTAYLISEYGHADTVRAVLAAAGVDHHHEAVSAALDAWADTHGSQVLQFRRPTPTGS